MANFPASMRLLALFLTLTLAGCLNLSYSMETGPAVSVSVSRSDSDGFQKVSATLTGVSGPVDDWSDLQVQGCIAPKEGPIDVPHRFSSCGWDIRILFAPNGEVLYTTE